MGRRGSSPAQRETDCTQCLSNTPFCNSCLLNFSLPFIERLELASSMPLEPDWLNSGFRRFGAIFMMTTANRWANRREVIRRRLLAARIGPVVHIVNGSGVDELHAFQLLRQGMSQRHHQLAASWAHVAVAQHALKLKYESILLVEDDAMFKRGAAASLNRQMVGLEQRTDGLGNWSLMRLGYSYRWSRVLSPCSEKEESQFIVASGPRDIRSSVAVAYRQHGIRTAANMRFYRFSSSKSIDMILSWPPWTSELLAMPPLVSQSSATAPRKVSAHLTSALVLLGKCSNLTSKGALASPAGSVVRAAWDGWNRSGSDEYALSAGLLNCEGVESNLEAASSTVRP